MKKLSRIKEVLKCPIRATVLTLAIGAIALISSVNVSATELPPAEEVDVEKFTQPEAVATMIAAPEISQNVTIPEVLEVAETPEVSEEETLIGPDGFWNMQRGEGWTEYFTEQDVLDCAWVLWFEYGACQSRTEKSKVVWTICNRVDDPRWANDFRGVVSAPGQFSWHGTPNTKRMSEDVITVARDVLERWNAEKNGMTNVGRTLPKDSIGFWGDGRRNHFYAQTWPGPRVYYDFSPEEGPYDN